MPVPPCTSRVSSDEISLCICGHLAHHTRHTPDASQEKKINKKTPPPQKKTPRCRSSGLAVPLDRRPRLLLNQPLHQVRAHDVVPEPLLLQELEVPQRRPRVDEVLEIRRLGPVLQVSQVGDEGGLREQLLRREVVEVVGVRERLDELGGTSAFRRRGDRRQRPAAGRGAGRTRTSSSISKRE